jgi:2-C-methyl-D-erythritol 4-phosphate cytidylyltransferase/2-C-methyl-D-erythritol 2,4-cyclodiphosphate synthase
MPAPDGRHRHEHVGPAGEGGEQGKREANRMNVAVIIAAAGRGRRFGSEVPKQLQAVGGRSLLTRSIEAFCAVPRIRELVVVVPPDHVADAAQYVPPAARDRVAVVAGGARRQDSVALGAAAVSAGVDVVLVHDAARAFVPVDVIERTIDAAGRTGAAIAALPVHDTVKLARLGGPFPVVSATLVREEIFLAQTPQGFRRDVFEAAIALGRRGVEATDEARLAEAAGYEVAIVEGDARSLKVTTAADLDLVLTLSSQTPPGSDGPQAAELRAGAALGDGVPAGTTVRVGVGYDSHRLVEGRRLVLGGIQIPFERGLMGHSDADAVAHAVTDAVLGASSMGDIGDMFPDSDPQWADTDSLGLLAKAVAAIHASGYAVVNVDVTIVAERPRILPYRDRIRTNLAAALGIAMADVSVKAKTNEGIDAVGRGEAIVVHAVALVARGRG